MDDFEFIEAVCFLAELPQSLETPGVARDDEMDALIFCARRIKAREGYSVETVRPTLQTA